MWERIGVVFRKEMTDSLRDRRTVWSALFYPLMGPILMFIMISVVARTFSSQADQPLTLAVAGQENAPSFVQFLKQNDVVVVAAPADPAAEVREGNVDVVVVVPPTFAAEFSAGRPATIQIVADDSRQSASVAVKRAEKLVQSYGQQMGALRLLARGVSPSVAQPLAIEHQDVSTPQSQAAGMLNIMPYFIVFAVFTGGMGLAIDTTVGERERGSLEPLLINPVARGELVIGKLGATLVFSVAAVLETLVGFLVMLNQVPLDELGMQVHLEAAPVAAIFLLALPMTLLAGALQMIIATSTRNFKEAQNYLGFLPLIPALPGMILAFVPFKPVWWSMLIPTFGQQVLINQLMRGETINPAFVALSELATLLVGGLLTWTAIRLFQSEQAVTGR